MNPISEDIKTVLVEQGIGVFAGTDTSEWGIYISHYPDNPPNIIAVYDHGGDQEGCFNPLAPRWLSSAFEIMIRHPNYGNAWKMAWRVSALLEKHPELFRNCPGTLRSFRLSSPTLLMKDERRRSVMSITGVAYREEDDEFSPTPTPSPTA